MVFGLTVLMMILALGLRFFGGFQPVQSHSFAGQRREGVSVNLRSLDNIGAGLMDESADMGQGMAAPVGEGFHFLSDRRRGRGGSFFVLHHGFNSLVEQRTPSLCAMGPWRKAHILSLNGFKKVATASSRIVVDIGLPKGRRVVQRLAL